MPWAEAASGVAAGEFFLGLQEVPKHFLEPSPARSRKDSQQGKTSGGCSSRQSHGKSRSDVSGRSRCFCFWKNICS